MNNPKTRRGAPIIECPGCSSPMYCTGSKNEPDGIRNARYECRSCLKRFVVQNDAIVHEVRCQVHPPRVKKLVGLQPTIPGARAIAGRYQSGSK